MEESDAQKAQNKERVQPHSTEAATATTGPPGTRGTAPVHAKMDRGTVGDSSISSTAPHPLLTNEKSPGKSYNDIFQGPTEHRGAASLEGASSGYSPLEVSSFGATASTGGSSPWARSSTGTQARSSIGVGAGGTQGSVGSSGVGGSPFSPAPVINKSGPGFSGGPRIWVTTTEGGGAEGHGESGEGARGWARKDSGEAGEEEGMVSRSGAFMGGRRLFEGAEAHGALHGGLAHGRMEGGVTRGASEAGEHMGMCSPLKHSKVLECAFTIATKNQLSQVTTVSS